MKLNYALFAGLVLFSAGCGDGPNTNTNTNNNQNTNTNTNNNNNTPRPYKVVTVQNPGMINGRVTYSLPRLQPRKIDARGDPACPHTVISDLLVVSPEGGIKNTVVSLEGIVEGKAPAQKDVLLNNGCMYVPHVLALSVATKVEIVNDDNTLHNIHGYSENLTLFNNALPFQGMKITKTFPKAGVYKMRCDVHPWMFGWIVASEHPYSVVTDDNGAFTLTDVPTGTYTLSVWHEKKEWDVKKKIISCEGGKITTASFSFP